MLFCRALTCIILYASLHNSLKGAETKIFLDRLQNWTWEESKWSPSLHKSAKIYYHSKSHIANIDYSAVFKCSLWRKIMLKFPWSLLMNNHFSGVFREWKIPHNDLENVEKWTKDCINAVVTAKFKTKSSLEVFVD